MFRSSSSYLLPVSFLSLSDFISFQLDDWSRILIAKCNPFSMSKRDQCESECEFDFERTEFLISVQQPISPVRVLK
jgi:hypothetical protein